MTQPDIGEFTLVADGSLARLFAFGHGAAPHTDPPEEIFSQPSIIFTLADHWYCRLERDEVEVSPAAVVLGNAGQPYRCRHAEAVPHDRTLSLDLHWPRVYELLSRYLPLADEISAEGRLFSRGVVPVTPRLGALQARLAVEAQTRLAGYPLSTDLIAMEVLLEVLRLSGGLPAEAPEPSPARYRDQIEAARAYLDAHFAEKVDLTVLAETAALNPFYFRRLFRNLVGQSPHQYLLERRMAQAARLLRDTSLSITDICYQVGFRSLSHFVTSFRRHTGRTPSSFRRP